MRAHCAYCGCVWFRTADKPRCPFCIKERRVAAPKKGLKV